MKLLYHPISTVCRPVMQLCKDYDVDCEMVLVDLMTGEHMQAPYASLNPNCLVPTLEDDDLILTESSAILKYIADKHGLPVYSHDLKQRAKVNEIMDWFNVNFYRDYGYHLIYPQLFPHHRREPELANEVTIVWGRDKSIKWLTILNDYYLGDGRNYLCGNEITIADYFGSGIISLGDAISVNLSGFTNIKKWMDGLRRRPSWKEVYEIFDGYCASLRDKEFVTIAG